MGEIRNNISIEDKELLIKELCARLPYGVEVEHKSGFGGILHDIVVYPLYEGDTIKDYVCTTNFFGEDDYVYIEYFKPCLFPLSSMTDEQKQEYLSIINYISPDDTDNWREGEFIYVDQISQLMHFFYSNHLDFRGLIPKGLAIDMTNKNIIEYDR